MSEQAEKKEAPEAVPVDDADEEVAAKASDATAAAEEEAPAQPRVFVGNLPFDITDALLAEAFGEGVVSATVISRRAHPLGYGFVTFETMESASAAVARLNDTELHDRRINVEIARPRTVKPQQPKKKRTNKKKRPANGDEQPKENDAAADGEEKKEGEEKPPRKRKPNKRRGKKKPAGGEAGGDGEERKQEERPPQPPKKRWTIVESDTMVFVEGIPEGFTEEELKGVFTGAGYNVVTTSLIPRRKVREGMSKVLGYVDLTSNEEQTRSIEQLSGVVVNNAAITLKIARNRVQEDVPEGTVIPKKRKSKKRFPKKKLADGEADGEQSQDENPQAAAAETKAEASE